MESWNDEYYRCFAKNVDAFIGILDKQFWCFTGYQHEPLMFDGARGSQQSLTFTSPLIQSEDEITVDVIINNGRIGFTVQGFVCDKEERRYRTICFNVRFIRDVKREELRAGGYKEKTLLTSQAELDLEAWLLKSHAHLICAEKLMFSPKTVAEKLFNFIA